MRYQLLSTAAISILCITQTNSVVYAGEAASATIAVSAAKPRSPAATSVAAPLAQVQSGVDELDAWLGNTANGRGWRSYLKLEELRAELAKRSAADPAALAQVNAQLTSGAKGLELPQFARLASALKAWQEELSQTSQPIAEVAAAAKSQFTPPAVDNPTRTALDRQLAALDRYLNSLGANGKAWKHYLMLGELRSELNSPTPDLKILAQANQRFSADHQGLELPVFANAGTALSEHLAALETRVNADLRTQYESRLEALTKGADEYLKAPSETGAIEVGSHLGWLERSGQARPLVQSFRRQHSMPNLYAQVSRDVVGAGIERNIDDMTPITDNILGTSISGTGRTQARVKVELVPSSRQAMLETILAGTTLSKTVGHNRSAIIWTDGTTTIEGRKRIAIAPTGISGLPATATADTKTRITGIGSERSGFLGDMVVKMASKKVAQKKSQAEEIGSQHAEDRVRARLDGDVAKQLATANADYAKKFRDPLLRRREFPQTLALSTSHDYLYVTSLQANTRQLGAPNAPPKFNAQHALAVQVHESLINNATSALLSGVTLNNEEVKARVIEMRGSLPDRFKEDEDREPWSITFAGERPVSVHFDDGGYEVTIRGSRYTSGDRQYKAMNITAKYKMEQSGDGSKLTRQGDLQIFPPDFVEGKSKFSVQQQALRTILQKKFGKIFAPEMVNDGLLLSGKWEQAGKLKLAQLHCDDGWLVLGWTKPNDRVAGTVAAVETQR